MISRFKKATTVLILGIVLGGASVPVFAGAVNGRRDGFYRVWARSTNSFQVTFRGGERAEVGVIGDGDTDLDLYVYDSRGNLVVWDDDSSDRCYVSWFPKYTATYTVKVVNRGNVYNDYRIMSN